MHVLFCPIFYNKKLPLKRESFLLILSRYALNFTLALRRSIMVQASHRRLYHEKERKKTVIKNSKHA